LGYDKLQILKSRHGAALQNVNLQVLIYGADR
jgi:hypothetical protein